MNPITVLLCAAEPLRRHWRTEFEGRGWRVIVQHRREHEGAPAAAPHVIVADVLSEAAADMKSAFSAVPFLLLSPPTTARAVADAVATGIRSEDKRFDSFVGNWEPGHEVRAMLGRLAGADCNVLSTGETGSGKELVAELIHTPSG